MNRLFAVCVLGISLTVAGRGQESTPWHDPSKHKVRFVTVEEGVRLEVLDWGGSGRPIVLLAGLGLTAHVFDGFAEKLTDSAAAPYRRPGYEMARQRTNHCCTFTISTV